MCVYYYLLGSTSVQGKSNFRLLIMFQEYFGGGKDHSFVQDGKF
jgi:hypothetical protein